MLLCVKQDWWSPASWSFFFQSFHIPLLLTISKRLVASAADADISSNVVVLHTAKAFLSSTYSSSFKTVTSFLHALLCLFFRRPNLVLLSLSESLRFCLAMLIDTRLPVFLLDVSDGCQAVTRAFVRLCWQSHITRGTSAVGLSIRCFSAELLWQWRVRRKRYCHFFPTESRLSNISDH